MSRGSTFGSGGGSVIVQPVGSQTKPTVIQRELETFKRTQFTADDLGDPAKLFQVLQKFENNVATVLRILAQIPVGGGNIVQGVVFTTGQTLLVQHGLGHDYRGWWCCRAQGLVASLVEAALPAGTTKTQGLPLTSANAGTYDLYVF